MLAVVSPWTSPTLTTAPTSGSARADGGEGVGGVIATNPDRIECPYAVGDVLITANAAQPSNRWPGTRWTQIKDVFPLAAGDSHEAGSTGGEETVALTAENNGPHTHVENFTYSLGVRPVASEAVGNGNGKYFSAENQGSAGPSKYVSTAESGGGEPHNNMPPYKAFFMWQRTA